MLHVCRNQVVLASSLEAFFGHYMVTTRSLQGHYDLVLKGSSFEPTRIILVAYAACCVPDSVSLRFEFSFMNGSSFEPILGSFWSRMLRGCFQIRFRYVSNLVS